LDQSVAGSEARNSWISLWTSIDRSLTDGSAARAAIANRSSLSRAERANSEVPRRTWTGLS
jgi:hypothetical protein